MPSKRYILSSEYIVSGRGRGQCQIYFYDVAQPACVFNVAFIGFTVISLRCLIAIVLPH